MQSEDNNDDDEWTDEAFDEFYDKLVDVKHDEGYQEQCSKIFDYAGHMFSLVCSFVLSDLEKDLENRRGNPLAKSYPGKLEVYYYLKISSAKVDVAYVLFIPFFGFWSLLATSYLNMKILHNLSLPFASQDGQDGKKRKENHTTKVTKNQKPKEKIWDEKNNDN